MKGLAGDMVFVVWGQLLQPWVWCICCCLALSANRCAHIFVTSAYDWLPAMGCHSSGCLVKASAPKQPGQLTRKDRAPRRCGVWLPHAELRQSG